MSWAWGSDSQNLVSGCVWSRSLWTRPERRKTSDNRQHRRIRRPSLYSRLKNEGDRICVLMIYCGLNNNTFKLFLREHIVRYIMEIIYDDCFFCQSCGVKFVFGCLLRIRYCSDHSATMAGYQARVMIN